MSPHFGILETKVTIFYKLCSAKRSPRCLTPLLCGQSKKTKQNLNLKQRDKNGGRNFFPLVYMCLNWREWNMNEWRDSLIGNEREKLWKGQTDWWSCRNSEVTDSQARYLTVNDMKRRGRRRRWGGCVSHWQTNRQEVNDALNTLWLTAKACSLSLWSWASSHDILRGGGGRGSRGEGGGRWKEKGETWDLWEDNRELGSLCEEVQGNGGEREKRRRGRGGKEEYPRRRGPSSAVIQQEIGGSGRRSLRRVEAKISHSLAMCLHTQPAALSVSITHSFSCTLRLSSHLSSPSLPLSLF